MSRWQKDFMKRMGARVALRDVYNAFSKWHTQYIESKEEENGMKQKFAKIVFAAMVRSRDIPWASLTDA